MNRQEERELKLMSELLMDEQSSVAAISAAALFFRKVFANRQGPSTSIIISNTHVIPALIRVSRCLQTWIPVSVEQRELEPDIFITKHFVNPYTVRFTVCRYLSWRIDHYTSRHE